MHCVENVRAYHLFKLAQADDPLYWKSKQYAARVAFMLDPNRWTATAGTARRLMKEILEKFPNNRFAKYYVNGMYKYSGDIEPESGYIRHAADTEHSAEWTGDTLPMMLLIDYGNPLWIEHGLEPSATLWSQLSEALGPSTGKGEGEQ